MRRTRTGQKAQRTLQFNISTVLLVVAVVCFLGAALQPAFLPDAINLLNLGLGFVVASFLFQSKPA